MGKDKVDIISTFYVIDFNFSLTNYVTDNNAFDQHEMIFLLTKN